MTFDKDIVNKFFSELNISYADISQSNIILFPILLDEDNIFYLITIIFLIIGMKT